MDDNLRSVYQRLANRHLLAAQRSQEVLRKRILEAVRVLEDLWPELQQDEETV